MKKSMLVDLPIGLPKQLKFYNMWYPMLLLVPQLLWNRAVLHQDAEMIEAVQIYNGCIENKTIRCAQKYNIRDPNSIIAWLDDCFTHKEFSNALSQ